MTTGVEHYENFPVASWLCPPHLRPVIAAIYWFARTADDIADEGNASAAQRLQDLAVYRAELSRIAQTPHAPPSAQWPHVFGPLSTHLHAHRLPVYLLHDLLSAFEQDVIRTEQGLYYQSHQELLNYCRLSANPIGRLLLHLYGITDPQRLIESDRICSALQLINFWQDLSVDLPRQRHYLPLQEMNALGLTPSDFAPEANTLATLSQERSTRKALLIASLLDQAYDLMKSGQALPLHVPGRAGWELRLVVQGGLRTAEKIRHLNHQTWLTRPKLRPLDAPVLLWRAWRMRAKAT
jgi:squalene synthase HpnC